jgi:hypothetical protein
MVFTAIVVASSNQQVSLSHPNFIIAIVFNFVALQLQHLLLHSFTQLLPPFETSEIS